jgi:hypothetical protein
MSCRPVDCSQSSDALAGRRPGRPRPQSGAAGRDKFRSGRPNGAAGRLACRRVERVKTNTSTDSASRRAHYDWNFTAPPAAAAPTTTTASAEEQTNRRAPLDNHEHGPTSSLRLEVCGAAELFTCRRPVARPRRQRHQLATNQSSVQTIDSLGYASEPVHICKMSAGRPAGGSATNWCPPPPAGPLTCVATSFLGHHRHLKHQRVASATLANEHSARAFAAGAH